MPDLLIGQASATLSAMAESDSSGKILAARFEPALSSSHGKYWSTWKRSPSSATRAAPEMSEWSASEARIQT